tara:strand:+ start:49 stop:156 length:108 start_codon:yes stop_codon:yes gene_type:complete
MAKKWKIRIPRRKTEYRKTENNDEGNENEISMEAV